MRKPTVERKMGPTSPASHQIPPCSRVPNVKIPTSRSPAECRWTNFYLCKIKFIFSSWHKIATIQENIFDSLSVLTLSFPSTSDLSTGNHQVQWKSYHAMSVTNNTAPTPAWNSTLDKSIRIGTLDESLVTSRVQNVERYIPTRLDCGNTRRAFME